MAEQYGLPIDAISGSIIALLRGKVTSEQASRRLFGAVAEPVQFVEAYFEKVNTQSSQLPNWMSKFGSDFQERFAELRSKLQPIIGNDFVRSEFDKLITKWPTQLGKTVLRMGGKDVKEFGVHSDLLTMLLSDEQFAKEVPACEVVGNVLTIYVRQIIGFKGTEAKIERSFGGDLVHALYLPHVDLWRGDRRFSVMVKEAVPRYADRVVENLKQLPDAIDLWPTIRNA